MRIATYNVEWMNSLFDDEGNLLADDRWSSRRDVTRIQQIEALGIVFNALDADAVMVIEAPDSHRRRDGVAALETFADWAGIRARKAIQGFINETQQEIALLYDPDVLTCRHDPIGPETGKKGSGDAPRFDGVFRIDLDIDATLDQVVWSKPPLELAVETASGKALRLIGVHAKSKAPHGARGREEVMRTAIANRRKQLAQCIWLRRRAEAHLASGDSLIILGDFNDGPGLDEYEKLFGRSGVEIVLGEEGETQLFDPHAALAMQRTFGAMPATARFWQQEHKRWLSVLLDYIMVSPDLKGSGAWRIWHPFDDPDCYGMETLREALLTASDHFPVTLDLDL